MKKGFIFVIPNQALTEKREGFDFMNRWITLNQKDYIPLGISLSKEDTYVQVWVGDEEVDNWTSNSDKLGQRFPSWLPLSILKDVKEGDTIKLKWNNETIELIANQLDYRYKRFGKFEDVLKSIL